MEANELRLIHDPARDVIGTVVLLHLEALDRFGRRIQWLPAVRTSVN